MRSVVFSGHRDVLDEHVSVIGDAVAKVCETADNLYLGGAAGADFLALMKVCDIVHNATIAKVHYHIPHVWVVVPATLDKQPGSTQEAVLRARNSFFDKFTLVEMGLPYSGASLKARNFEMIDRAISTGGPELLAYFRGIWKSGTYSAMHYAGKNKVPIVQILS